MGVNTNKRLPKSQKVMLLGIKQLQSCLGLDQLALGGLWNQEHWIRELTTPNRLCIGIMQSQNLIAMACGWLVTNELQITLVAVHPDHRNQGLGRKILLSILNEAWRNGVTLATLEVADTNQAAKSLYKSCGFKTAGCRRGLYVDGRDALIQWKNLTNKD